GEQRALWERLALCFLTPNGLWYTLLLCQGCREGETPICEPPDLGQTGLLPPTRANDWASVSMAVPLPLYVAVSFEPSPVPSPNGSWNASPTVMMPIPGQGLEMSLHHQSSMKDGRGRATLSRRLRRWRNPCAAIAIGMAHLACRNCYCPLGILEMVLCHVPDTWCRYLKHVSAFS
ncbi:unnamed protein product, partial [Ixodes pacificus]